MTDLICDGNSIFARAWFATMSKPESTPTDAIRAGLTTVFSLLNANNDKLGERIDRILFAWDDADKRDKGREPKPAEYHETRELLIEYLTLLAKPAHAQVKAQEADDVVATAVTQSDADTVYVVSGDKDLQQLAGGHVLYYCLNTKALLSTRSICDKWNVKRPNQVALALAILGDKVDKIQGIKGWGPSRVKKLFQTVSPDMTLEEALRSLESQIAEAATPQVLENFYHDLDLTLLRDDLEGVPAAMPVEIAPPEVVDALKLPQFMEFYRPVYRLYHERTDPSGDEEDVPQH